MKILVLGCTGMLGNAVFRYLTEQKLFQVWGTARSSGVINRLPSSNKVIGGVDVENFDSLCQVFAKVKPDVVINCIGLVKQLAESNDPLLALPINALLPHRLARLCGLTDSRLIHVSTDCVFTGLKGNYVESDAPDAMDLYGRSKLIGEVDYPHAVTLRTSIIGHELASSHGLIGWFLDQNLSVRGFTRAVFSGLPTCELARIIAEHVLPNEKLCGLYHVSSSPISKHDLLKLVAKTYNHNIEILADDKLIIDRSLDSSRFRSATGYQAPPWFELVQSMYSFG
ncbi:SDR family oxidoreductase [Chromobacterium sp. Beijing]|uniref:dTDP-4-dehydrorhamnose reductase family protein n=1 Tax=Chromobacterium sp. Beijing TaxID=2735795 RepID=UPI001F1B8AC3|nr:SDR family oxidoreductase [Chromobacterium sp. Beijing]UJB33579.1 SDR family oxidoreductase [Chromobacterium sp. Beijing]